MSIRYVATALDHLPEVKGTEALVLVALCDYASDDTRECWPSIGTVARRARCDRRTAQRCLKRLEGRGLIERALGGHQYGVNTASRYRLKFDYAGQIVPDTEPLASYPQGRRNAAPGAAPVSQKGGISSAQGRRNAAPSVIRSVIEPKSAKSAAKQRGEAAAKAAAVMTDAELEERARTGTLTAAQESEREHRRRFRKGAV